MFEPHLVWRLPGTEVWHWHPDCPQFPVNRSVERSFGWPTNGLLCAWCGSRGSGKPDLDERAHRVLSFLRGDSRLRRLGAHAERIAWQYGDARVQFSGISRTLSPVISRSDLRARHPVEIVESVCDWATREEAHRWRFTTA